MNNPYAAQTGTRRPAAPSKGRRVPTWAIVAIVLTSPCWLAILWGILALAIAFTPVLFIVAVVAFVFLAAVKFRTRPKRVRVRAKASIRPARQR